MARIINLRRASQQEEETGIKIGAYLQLKNIQTCYLDPVTKWSISGDDIKRIPDTVSQHLMASIRSGRFKVFTREEYIEMMKREG
jgi:hypothetical protein